MSDARPTRRRFLGTLALAGASAEASRTLGASGTLAIAQPRPRPDGATVELANGETVAGTRLSVGDATFALDDRSWPWEEVLDAAAAGGPVEPDAGRGWVELTGGDRLFGDATASDGETVAFTRPDGTLTLPAERVRAVRFAGAGPLTRWQRLAALRTRGADDLVLLRTGGRVGGELLGFDAAAVRLLTAAGEVSLPRGGVRGLALSPELQRPVEVPPRFLSVLLADGSTLTAAAIDYGPDGGALTTAAGVRVPLEPGSLRRLSAFTPATPAAGEPAVTFAPTPAGRPAPVANRTVTGRRAVADDRPWPIGRGVWGGTTLTFPVPAGATAFVAAFALDASAGELAECDPAAAVDGVPRWTRTGVRAGERFPVQVPLDAAKHISLTVAPGVLGPVRDEAFWVAPRFVVPQPPA